MTTEPAQNPPPTPAKALMPASPTSVAALRNLVTTTLVYAPPKKGKTVDMVLSNPRALFLGDPSTIRQAAISFGGFEPKVKDARTLFDATDLLVRIAARKEAGNPLPYDAMGVDDFSLICDETYAQIREEDTGKKGEYGPIVKLREAIIEFRRAARNAGLRLHLNAHCADPETKAGHYYMGGPKMPIRTTRDWLSVVSTTLLRAVVDTDRPGSFKVSLVCDPSDPSYLTGDRLDAAPPRGPVNTGEILRFRGLDVPRLVGCEWQEGVAEQIALALLDGKKLSEIAVKVIAKLTERGYDQRHIRWALRDGRDRAEIRRTNADRMFADYLSDGPVGPQL